ncbi:MAG: sialate O-acetylesterase [Sedimentisphaerales bacterium]
MKLNRKIFRLNVYCFVLFISQIVLGAVKLPLLVSDGMVLQRDANVKVWGWADANEKVAVSFNGHTIDTSAGADGKWAVTLSDLKAGGPYVMDINASNHIVLKDVMVGEVWVCSGQSNMELPMNRVKYKYPDVIAKAENTNIRSFNVPRKYDFYKPQDDLKSGKWVSANPKSVLDFTAVGYFFARELNEKYNVPIGLINSSLGGSPAEAWMSEDALKAFPAYLQTAEKFKDSNYIDQITKKDNAVSSEWNGQVNQLDKGQEKGQKPWFDVNYDASDWATMNVPGYWADGNLGSVNGVVWFRKEIDVPEAMAGKSAKLWLGRIVDGDFTYVNGKQVGSVSYQYPPRIYDVPANLLKAGKNIIVVRIISNSGKGGFVADKPYQLTVGEQTIDLQGKWQYKLGVATPPMPPGKTFVEWQPTGLYNGMLAPLFNYRIKGVIWYQGESNAGKGREYRKLFPALIANWREKWGQGDFPFLYVQLPNFMETKSHPSESGWAETREAQLKTLSVPNTGMAVAIDLGEWNDIHPLNKQDVGKRLALAAQKVAYGDSNVVYSGPIYQSMKIEGNKIILTFTNTGSGLTAKGGGELKYFAIAGADKKFVWAQAKIDGNNVVVWSDKVEKPVAVRYAWADNPEGANLYNKEGLPASPFETEE